MEMLTDSEIAAKLKVSRRQVWKLLATGRLPQPVRIGRSVRWKESDFNLWINGGCRALREGGQK